MVQKFQSLYHEIWNSLPDPADVKVVVELGLNDGDGTVALKSHFPDAQVFGIEKHIRSLEYNTPFEEIYKKLEGIATVIIQESPLPYDWAYPYDVCTIDIGSDPLLNFENVKYWIKYKKLNGVLAILIPRGNEEKCAKKEVFINLVKNQTDWKYKEAHFNWFFFT